MRTVEFWSVVLQMWRPETMVDDEVIDDIHEWHFATEKMAIEAKEELHKKYIDEIPKLNEFLDVCMPSDYEELSDEDKIMASVALEYGNGTEHQISGAWFSLSHRKFEIKEPHDG